MTFVLNAYEFQKRDDTNMNEEWQSILDDYKKAKYALWCPKHYNYWERDEDNGYFYMWKAYHAAINAEPKEHILFARILMMMAHEQRFKTSDYLRLKQYVKPAVEQYQLSIQNGDKPTEKELEMSQSEYDALTYQFACEHAPHEEQIKLINGYEKLKSFQFHDSKVIKFEHDENQAFLTLKFDNTEIILKFDDVSDIKIQTDPVCDWIYDFYCYRSFYGKDLLIFDIEFYRILCSSITVESIEDK